MHVRLLISEAVVLRSMTEHLHFHQSCTMTGCADITCTPFAVLMTIIGHAIVMQACLLYSDLRK